ncbi:hypothetical protein J3E64_002155 [Sphingobium sp. OAS761]|nr:hypothetical protein [Sphingobium sp. OAS761]
MAHATLTLFAPRYRYSVMHLAGYTSIKMVYVKLVESSLKAIDVGPQPLE